MRILAVTVATLLYFGGAVCADDLSAGYGDCGGDAFSSAQVVERRPARHGPLTAVPETLCADLAPQQPPTQIDIVANPILLPQVGPFPPPTPYGVGLPPVGWPSRLRNP